MAETKNSIKVTDSQRIFRIFEKICASHLHVFLRLPQRESTSVKANAVLLDEIVVSGRDRRSAIVLDGISDKGLQYIRGKTTINLEFVLLDSKIIAQCKLLDIRNEQAYLSLPPHIESVDKRSSTRYKINENIRAFFAFSLWQMDPRSLTSPPCFAQHQALAGFLPLTDVSLDGFCVLSRFPALSTVLTPESQDSAGKLYLPLCPSIELGVNIRWVKLIREQTHLGANYDAAKFFYYVGCQIAEHSPNSALALKYFIQSLLEAEAI